MNQPTPECIQNYCKESGYTDPFLEGRMWWAFPPNGVMPVPLYKKFQPALPIIEDPGIYKLCAPLPDNLEGLLGLFAMAERFLAEQACGVVQEASLFVSESEYDWLCERYDVLPLSGAEWITRCSRRIKAVKPHRNLNNGIAVLCSDRAVRSNRVDAHWLDADGVILYPLEIMIIDWRAHES